MISVAEVDRLLADALPSPTTEEVPLSQAVGRVLGMPLVADRDGPPYDRVAMDGYAVKSQNGDRLWLVRGLQYAGRPPQILDDQSTAIEVATGAVLPRGCDAVIPYESATRKGNTVVLNPDAPGPQPYAHVHRQGNDYRAGQTLLPQGTVLQSPHLHCLASVGTDPVTVVRRARWALVATGDELVDVRDQPQAWQIRRSNAAAIVGEASAWGLAPRAQTSLPDDASLIRRGLDPLLPDLDVLVLTGGVSAGALDLVPGVMADLGAEVLFHHVAQKPGKPFWCGRLPAPASTLVFGLPGNPVSSLFVFRRFVLPWLRTFEGRSPADLRVALDQPAALPAPGHTIFRPWSGTAVLDWKGSGDFFALAEARGFVQFDDPRSAREPRYFPWGGSQ